MSKPLIWSPCKGLTPWPQTQPWSNPDHEPSVLARECYLYLGTTNEYQTEKKKKKGQNDLMDEDPTHLVLHLLKPLGKFSSIQLNNLA